MVAQKEIRYRDGDKIVVKTMSPEKQDQSPDTGRKGESFNTREEHVATVISKKIKEKIISNSAKQASAKPEPKESLWRRQAPSHGVPPNN